MIILKYKSINDYLQIGYSYGLERQSRKMHNMRRLRGRVPDCGARAVEQSRLGVRREALQSLCNMRKVLPGRRDKSGEKIIRC